MRIVKAQIVNGVAFLTAEDSQGNRNTKKAVADEFGFRFVLGHTGAYEIADTPGEITLVRRSPHCSCPFCDLALHTEKLTRDEWEIRTAYLKKIEEKA